MSDTTPVPRALGGALFALLVGASSAAAAADAAHTGPIAGTARTDGAATTADSGPRTLDTVVVSGVQPGPGLWKVSKGGHALYVLGTLAPLPKRMAWESREVEALIAEADAVLYPPSAKLGIDGGPLKALLLMPSLMSARNNPQKQKLVDVVPASIYARWTPLKAKYLGRDDGVEKRRPIVAAMTLYQEAVDDAGMSFEDVVMPVVKKAAKRRKLTPIEPAVEVKVRHPRAAVKAFKQTSLDDVACFEKTLTRLEHDVETLVDRANAWAVGDVASLRELPYTDQIRTCVDAVLGASLADRVGMGDLDRRVAAAWLEAAETALAEHRITFAVLPIRAITDEPGYVQALAARGYAVEAPPSDAARVEAD